MVNVLEEKKGEDILLMDVRGVAGFTDFFVFCSGTSNRMLGALSDAIVDHLSANKKFRGKIEGNGDSGWMVIDLGDVVVHVLSPEQRSYYKIEDVWEDGKILLRLQ